MIRLTTLLGIPIVIRSVEVVATMNIMQSGHSMSHRLRLFAFALGYAILAAATLSTAVDAWQGEATWREFLFVCASALLILGDKRKNINYCFRRNCPGKE